MVIIARSRNDKKKALLATRRGSGVALSEDACPEMSRPMLPVACDVGSPRRPRHLLVLPLRLS